MALQGAWNRSQDGLTPYADEQKQGNGVSGIFSVRGGGGRNIAPAPTFGEIPTEPGFLDEEDISGNGWIGSDEWLVDYVPQIGHPPAENATEVGTRDRPEWGTDDLDTRARVTPLWPSYDESGDAIRAERHGGTASSYANVTPVETVTEGWRNKESESVEYDGAQPPIDQTFIQTSAAQRNLERSGSQISGTASEYAAPIKSRIIGPKLKFWSGEDRHYDMAPKAQEQIIRPFWNRSMGTGYGEWMQTNDLYQSQPRLRVTPPDPAVGDSAGFDQVDNYGFVAEDATW